MVGACVRGSIQLDEVERASARIRELLARERPTFAYGVALLFHAVCTLVQLGMRDYSVRELTQIMIAKAHARANRIATPTPEQAAGIISESLKASKDGN